MLLFELLEASPKIIKLSVALFIERRVAGYLCDNLSSQLRTTPNLHPKSFALTRPLLNLGQWRQCDPSDMARPEKAEEMEQKHPPGARHKNSENDPERPYQWGPLQNITKDTYTPRNGLGQASGVWPLSAG